MSKIRTVTEAELVSVERMSAEGKPEHEIAAGLGMNRGTWRSLKRRDERVAAALERGRSVPGGRVTVGRSKKALPEHACEIIVQMAREGVKQSDIAQALGVSYQTFQRMRDEHEEVVNALRAGRTIEEDRLVGSLFTLAMKGNVTAAIFLLKARHSYNDRGGDAAEPRVNVQITLPGARSVEDYARTIETTPVGKEATRLIEQGKDEWVPPSTTVDMEEADELDPILH